MLKVPKFILYLLIALTLAFVAYMAWYGISKRDPPQIPDAIKVM